MIQEQEVRSLHKWMEKWLKEHNDRQQTVPGFEDILCDESSVQHLFSINVDELDVIAIPRNRQ